MECLAGPMRPGQSRRRRGHWRPAAACSARRRSRTRPDAAAPLTSPVTDAARAASAATAATLPAHVPPGDEPAVTIDALGRKCPIPIIMLAEQIRDVPVGAVIAVLADDPAAYSDIPAWCGLKSHDCVFRAGYATGWSFGVRRRY